MKKAIKFLAVYLFYFLAISIIGTLFYMAYLGIATTTAGQKLTLWNKDLFIKALFYVLLCTLFIVFPFIISYRIRHKGGVAQSIIYILICVVNWGILFPVLLNQANKVGYQEIREIKKINSAEYFRESGNEIYYFTKDLVQDGQAVPSIVISPDKEQAVEYKNVTADENFVLFKVSAPYNDIFTKKAFPNDFVFNFIEPTVIFKNAFSALEKGWTFWLGFLSLAFLISTLYCISNFFDWKLLDTALIIVVFVVIILCNTYYFMPGFLSFRLKYLSGGFFTFLSRFIDNSPIVVLNIFTSIVFIIIGLVKLFKKRKSAAE